MGNTKENIQAAIARMGEEHSEEIKNSIEVLLTNIFEKGMLPKDAMGLSDSMVEGIYGHAYRLYNTGKYQEAGQLFRLLIMLNPIMAKYPLGLAACFHMAKDYESAATTYALVSVIDPTSPIPYYHASDCYIQMKDLSAAIVSLEMAIDLCVGKDQFSLIRERSLFSIESLKRELGEGEPIENRIVVTE